MDEKITYLDDGNVKISYYENGNIRGIFHHGNIEFGPKLTYYKEDGRILGKIGFHWNYKEVSENEYNELLREKEILDFEEELLNTIPESNNHSIIKAVKF